MNTDLRKIVKIDSEKDFFSLMNNSFEKTMENMRKHRYSKLATTERRINYLALKPNYMTLQGLSHNIY